MINKNRSLRAYLSRLAESLGFGYKAFAFFNSVILRGFSLRNSNLRKKRLTANELSEIIRVLREQYRIEEEKDIRDEYEYTVDEEIGFSFLAELNKKKSITSKLAFLMNTAHPFHILLPSPWPFGAATAAFILTSGTVMYMHSHLRGWYTLKLGVYGTIFVMYLWWRDVIREAKCEKRHNPRVKLGLTFGVVLFITSEAMFFFTFFWTFFYFSCMPSFDPEHTWPPKAVQESRHLGMATFNTLVLLSSATTVTWAHYSVMKGDKKHAVEALSSTIFLACLFMCIQLYEYRTYPFCMSDGIYGSCFYILTGFHGFHVFLGTAGLLVALRRIVHNSFTLSTHLGFEAAICYWHFVDVVWLVVYLTVYWWGNS
jgi:heme/copper-type cytochrome/quinol oxidase subunit 3